MESLQQDLSNQIIDCITGLKSSSGQDASQLQVCSKISEQHGVDPDDTKAELTKLISAGRLVFMESNDGDITYSTVSQKHKKSRPEAAPPLNDTMKEISHLISKCVKQINLVNFFLLSLVSWKLSCMFFVCGL